VGRPAFRGERRGGGGGGGGGGGERRGRSGRGRRRSRGGGLRPRLGRCPGPTSGGRRRSGWGRRRLGRGWGRAKAGRGGGRGGKSGTANIFVDVLVGGDLVLGVVAILRGPDLHAHLQRDAVEHLAVLDVEDTDRVGERRELLERDLLSDRVCI